MSSMTFAPLRAHLLSSNNSTRMDSELLREESMASESVKCEEHSCSFPAPLTVATNTKRTTQVVHWNIDARSLQIAQTHAKGVKAGVLEADVVMRANGQSLKLEMCASGWKTSQTGYAAFYLTAPDSADTAERKEDFVARYTVALGDDIRRTSSVRNDFHLGVGFPNFCMKDTMPSLVCDGLLRFCVELEVFESSVTVSKHTPVPSLCLPTADNVLGAWTRSLFETRDHSDVTLVCGSLRICAHKCLLAAASPVFRSMFAHQMLEATTSEVQMGHWNADAVQSVVYFIYNGRLPPGDFSERESSEGALRRSPSSSMSEASDGSATMRLDDATVSGALLGLDADDVDSDMLVAAAADECYADARVPFGLFQLAEFYKIQPLVVACCEQMHRRLTVQTACELLVRVQRYLHVDEVQTIADSLWRFVADNIHEVKRSVGYKRMLCSQPQLLEQLIDRITQ